MLSFLSIISLVIPFAHGLCPDQNFIAPPVDPSQPGAYPVGALTFQRFTEQPRDFIIEVWYPGQPGSEAGREKKVYDTRENLPARYEDAIPDGIVDQFCECYDSLPPAYDDGPFPFLLFIHGSGGYKTQAMTQLAHIASRGFVVISANNPGITLRDALDLGGGNIPNQAGDSRIIIDIINNVRANPTLSFLDGLVDPTRIAISGQSAGGNAAVSVQDLGRVVIPMAAGGVLTEGESHLILGGAIDTVVPYTAQQQSYANSTPVKRLVGFEASGHLGVTPDMCYIGRDEGGFIAIAIRYGIREAILFEGLYDGCEDFHLTPEVMWPPLNFVTSAALEEVLMCDFTMGPLLANVTQFFPEIIHEYQQELS